MKKLMLLLLLIMGVGIGQNNLSAQMHHSKWKEMEDFHEIMAVVFHSAEGDLFNPLKENSGMLVEKAKTWQASPIPAGHDAKATKKTLKALVKQCKKVDKMVKQGKPDAELMVAIAAAHDIFHQAMH